MQRGGYLGQVELWPVEWWPGGSSDNKGVFAFRFLNYRAALLATRFHGKLGTNNWVIPRFFSAGGHCEVADGDRAGETDGAEGGERDGCRG